MSLPYPVHDTGMYSLASPMSNVTGTRMLHFWIKVAQIQGQVYEKLFSAAAFLQPFEERARTAQQLVKALQEAWVERGDASALDFAFVSTANLDGHPKTGTTEPNDSEAPSKLGKRVFQFPTASQQCFGSEGQPGPMSAETSESSLEGFA